MSSSGKLKRVSSVADDLLVLKSIWFNKASGDDHAERLENFYGPQAEACEHARAKEVLLLTFSAIFLGLKALNVHEQMTTFVPSSCGAESLCLPRALLGWQTKLIWCGSILEAEQGFVHLPSNVERQIHISLGDHGDCITWVQRLKFIQGVSR